MIHAVATRDDLALATLMGCVARLASRQTGARADAVDEVRRTAGGRADLLGLAAGTYRAETLSGDRAFWFSDTAARLCVDAGADVTVARATVPDVVQRLAQRRRGPAGGPSADENRHAPDTPTRSTCAERLKI